MCGGKNYHRTFNSCLRFLFLHKIINKLKKKGVKKVAVNEKNILIEVKDENGNVVREFPITKASNIIGLKKLISEAENGKYLAALKLLAANPYIIDDTDQKIYRIGIEDGNIYAVEVEYGIEQILNQSSDDGSPGTDPVPGSIDTGDFTILQQEISNVKKQIPKFSHNESEEGLIISVSSLTSTGSNNNEG